MKVICNRGALLDAINQSGAVASARSPKPALACVKLTADPDRLTIAATDLEVAVRCSDSEVQVEQPGETLVPVDKLRDIVRESIDDSLSLQTEGEQIVIKGHDSVFKVYTQRPEDFPPVPEFEGDADLEIKAGTLKQAIAQTLFAAARENQRYAFNGVLFNVKGKRLEMVASDGRRLAMVHADLLRVGKHAGQSKVIVPAKALNLLDKLLTDPEEVVSLQLRENQVLFHTAWATLTSNLVDGQFPPYEDVIPKDADRKMVASTADFLSAVRRAALLTSDDSKGVRMSFSKGGLVLSSRQPDAGEATVNLPCKFEGADIDIGFNPFFLTDVLRVVDSDEITFEMTAPNRPGMLRSGSDFLYVIMPVNLS